MNARLGSLPYRKPAEGRDYWVADQVLKDPDAVRQRVLQRTDWIQGFPYRQESWPGMRVVPGLEPEELAEVEALVLKLTGVKRLWQGVTPEGAMLNHNCVQVVGEREAGPRPHTDSKRLCKYAAVLYLNPKVPKKCGTSFYRLRMPGGGLGGNTVPPPHANLPEALGTRFVPPDSFAEDMRLDYVYNRLLLYRADLIHSASAYWGYELEQKRMAAVFFWLAE
jgi:hypothetical protein